MNDPKSVLVVVIPHANGGDAYVRADDVESVSPDPGTEGTSRPLYVVALRSGALIITPAEPVDVWVAASRGNLEIAQAVSRES